MYNPFKKQVNCDVQSFKKQVNCDVQWSLVAYLLQLYSVEFRLRIQKLY